MAKRSNEKTWQWQLEDIFDSNGTWEKDYARAAAEISELKRREGTLGNDADALFSYLSEASATALLVERIFVYARMRRDEDNSNALYQGMSERANKLMVELDAACSFAVPEILLIPQEKLDEWMKQPRYKPFCFELSDIARRRAHTLSAQEEKLLAMAGEPLGGASDIFRMLSDVDLSFGTVTDENGQEVPLTHGSYGALIMSPDRRVRRDAYIGLYRAYRSMQNTLAATYATSVKADVFEAKARGYKGAMEMALYGNNVPVSVYEQLIEAVHESLPAMKKYLALRKKQLKLDQLEMYDLYTSIVPDAETPMEYGEAKSLVKKALEPLGDAYQELLERAYTEHWIDVYENDGKTSGAYSWGVYGTHPYVLLNHQDTLDGAFTLAHELGHAMHSYHSAAAQPYETASYRTMVAEVASTVNEMLMMRHLLKLEKAPARRAYLLNQLLESFRTTCFRQTMFAEFEMKAHRMAENGQPLNVESLSAMYADLNRLYYAGVNVDENIALEWARIPHFYRAFYVYQYATGLCTASKLSGDILEHGALGRYIKFLSSGGSDYPIKLLQDAGVDLTDKNSIKSALRWFEQSVDELAELLS